MTRIEIVVSASGETRVATYGYAGSACQSASGFLEQAFGKRTHEQLTGEFYQELSAVSDRLAARHEAWLRRVAPRRVVTDPGRLGADRQAEGPLQIGPPAAPTR